MRQGSRFLLIIFYTATFSLAARGIKENSEPQEKSDITEFSILFADFNPNYINRNTAIEQYLAEKTGVKLNFLMENGDPEEYINRVVASGNLPDLICPKGTDKGLIGKRSLLDLTDLIDTYAPNIKAMLGDQIRRLKYSPDDPSIYYIPNNDKFNPILFEATGPFYIQLAALEFTNYPYIRTLEDYENIIRCYVRNNPEINGEKTLGISLIAENYRMLISVTNPAFQATGATDDGEFYINPETLEAVLHYKRPIERKYFRWLNHMYNTGLIDPASFIQTYDQYIKKIASGRVVALINQDHQILQGVNSLKAKGEYNRLYGTFPVTLSEDIPNKAFQKVGFMSGWGVGITKNCKDPVKAIQYLDYLASEEGQILVNWGLEGTHYYYADNGQRKFFPEYQSLLTKDPNGFKEKTNIGNFNISLQYGDGNRDSTGNFYTTIFPEQITSQYSDYQKKVLSHYGIQFWKELYPKEDNFPIKPWGSGWAIPMQENPELSLFWDKEQEIIRKRIPEAILSSPEEFDTVYDTMLQEFEEINTKEMEKVFSDMVKARIQFWE